LLREDIVVRVLHGLDAKRIAEIGCGAGEIIVRLAREGFTGVAFDPAPAAREHARRRLGRAKVTSFAVTDEWPSADGFDVVLMLEVLGYLADPLAVLRRCRELVQPGGHVVLSFARVGAGYDPRVVAGMRLLDKAEVRHWLKACDFCEVREHNYGFPLANLLVGVNNAVYRTRLSLRDEKLEVGETGLAHTWGVLQPLALVSNRVTLAPFFWLQRALTSTDLGNGYVVCAKAAG
jgi:SAM-dependent methyltransferase